MSVCPKCGTHVTKPIKTWSMVGRTSKNGEQFKLNFGFFICPGCQKRFQNAVKKKKERITLKGAVKEIEVINKRFAQTLGDLREKIEKLKTERSELLKEIEELKKAGHNKINMLEEDVTQLREEVAILKEMLGDLE